MGRGRCCETGRPLVPASGQVILLLYRTRRFVHMRALSIRSFLIQACIVSVAIWPGRIGAEDRRSAAFRIEVSQPQYSSGAGQAWTCLTEALVNSKCRQSV